MTRSRRSLHDSAPPSEGGSDEDSHGVRTPELVPKDNANGAVNLQAADAMD